MFCPSIKKLLMQRLYCWLHSFEFIPWVSLCRRERAHEAHTEISAQMEDIVTRISISQFFLHFKVFLHAPCTHALAKPLLNAYHVSGPWYSQAIFLGHSSNTNKQKNFAHMSLVVKGYPKCFSLAAQGRREQKPPVSLFMIKMKIP